jgi:hypothetical protein
MLPIRWFVCACAIPVSACTTFQLPARTDVTVDSVPSLDAGTIIKSNNGLLSEGINTVPGTICVAGADGKCDPMALAPAQCLVSGSIVEVKPQTNPTPAYHSLVDNKYNAAADVPFVSPTANAEQLDEVKATIAGTAQIKSTSPNNGYPGIEGVKSCLLQIFGPGSYPTVYWISAANIIEVTKSHFVQVSSSTAVNATGFGFTGSTYNHNGIDEEVVWIGIQASKLSVGTVAYPAPPAPAPPAPAPPAPPPAPPPPSAPAIPVGPHTLVVSPTGPTEALPARTADKILP